MCNCLTFIKSYFCSLNTIREEEFGVKYSIQGPYIFKREVDHALKYIKLHKTTGPDHTTTETICPLEECGIQQINNVPSEYLVLLMLFPLTSILYVF